MLQHVVADIIGESIESSHRGNKQNDGTIVQLSRKKIESISCQKSESKKL